MPSSRRMEETLNTLTLPDLPEIPLPPLPPVANAELLRTALTHTSFHQLPRRVLDLDPQQPVKDYEKLEHVGDAVLGVVITLLLHDLFPYLREGPATFLKGHLVRDRTLAQLSDRYGLPDQLIGHKAALASTKRQEKTRSSLFEAYIAALYLSHVEGFERQNSTAKRTCKDHNTETTPDEQDATKAVTPLPGEEGSHPMSQLAAETAEQDATERDYDGGSLVLPADLPFPITPDRPVQTVIANDQPRSFGTSEITVADAAQPESSCAPYLSGRGFALAKVDEWLRPLFTPMALWALDGMRAEQVRLEACPPPKPAAIKIPAEWAVEDEQAAGMAGALNVYVQNTSGNMPAYHHDALDERDPANPHTTIWRVTCVTRGKNGVVSAEATRFTKRGAQAVAAWKVYQQLGGP